MKNKATAIRDYGYDNIKFILIYCVVLGHMLAPVNFEHAGVLYKAIYTFHMPVFVFVSGFFSRFNRKKIIFNYLILYIIFQPLYIIYNRTFTDTAISIQFTYPEWIMWYLLNTMYYLLLIPFYNVDTAKKKIIILMLSFVLAIAAGFDKTIGVSMSVSRFLVFQPYFLMGYYYQKEKDKIQKQMCKFFAAEKWAAWLCLLIVAFLLILFCVNDASITINQCYALYAYNTFKDMLARIKLYILAITVTAALISSAKIVLNRKIPFISMIGKNTLPVYLLHGFIARLDKYGVVNFPDNILAYLLIAFGITLLLGNNFTAKCFNRIIPSGWFKKINR